MQLFEFYHQDTYNPNRFVDTLDAPIGIENITMYKPDGGLWASPVEEDETIQRWPDWVKSAGMNGRFGNRLEHKMTFGLEEWTNLLVIDSYQDLVNIAQKYKLTNEMLKDLVDYETYTTISRLSIVEKEKGMINWRAIAKDYDAVLATDKAVKASSACSYWHSTNLYSWDTASLVVFHKHVIHIISQE